MVKIRSGAFLRLSAREIRALGDQLLNVGRAFCDYETILAGTLASDHAEQIARDAAASLLILDCHKAAMRRIAERRQQ